MAKKYLRKSGCLSLKDADQLWLDLSAYRKATGSKTMYARQRFGGGWAIYEVVEVSDAEAKRSGAE